MAKILVADDHPGLLAAAGRLLRESGHLVTSTNNGGDVLCLLKHRPGHDLVVLDIVMPKLDGYEVLAALGPSAPPVLLISGGHIDPEKFDVSKVTRVLNKPFTSEEFLAKVAECLAESSPNLLDSAQKLDLAEYPLAREWTRAVEQAKLQTAAH